MNNLEMYGLELALLIKRQDAARAVLAEVTERIDAICKQISDEPSGTLYGSQTGEHFQVERNAVGWAVTSPAPSEAARIDPVEWIEGTSPAQKPRNQAPVPMSRPMRPDHQDGGSTFALTPIADSTSYAITETMPALVPCPRTSGGDMASCLELAAHLHQADGEVKRLADL